MSDKKSIPPVLLFDPKREAERRTLSALPFRKGTSIADVLDSYAGRIGVSNGACLRMAVGTFALLCDELLEGRRVMITDSNGVPLGEMVLPKKEEK